MYSLMVALSFVIACMMPSQLKSQEITYFNYLNYTSKWYYKMHWSGIHGESGINHDFYYVDGDTMIGGSPYYKIRNLHVLERINPSHSTTLSDYYAYALREDADSLFTYIYPNGAQKIVSNKPSGWPGDRILYCQGEIPHRVYWDSYDPILGWVEGIGEGQMGGIFPFEKGYPALQCYTRDTLSTTYTGYPCEFNYAITAVEEGKPMESISIFPNPASSSIYFTGLDQKIESMKIYSGSGTLVNTNYDVDGYAPVDISSYTAGMYFIVLSSNNKNYVGRFIVME